MNICFSPNVETEDFSLNLVIRKFFIQKSLLKCIKEAAKIQHFTMKIISIEHCSTAVILIVHYVLVTG